MTEEIEALTGLRGVAAFAVFLGHAGNYFDTPWRDITREGVGIFFVLSGFLMTHTYRACRMESRDCQRSFWFKRFARIVPAHEVALLMYVPTLACLSSASAFTIIETALTPFLLQNWITFKLFATLCVHWNPVTWTLSNEMFYYLCFPLLSRFLARHPKPFAAVAVFWCTVPTLVFALVLPDNYLHAGFSDSLVYECVVTRLGDFMCGMVAARLWHLFPDLWSASRLLWHLSTWVLPAVVTGLCFASAAFTGGTQVIGNGLLSPMVAVVLFGFALFPSSWLSRILSCAPVYRFGQISYTFYLLHLGFQPWVDNGFLWFFAALGAATCLRVLVEIPAHQWLCRRWGKTWSCQCRFSVTELTRCSVITTRE